MVKNLVIQLDKYFDPFHGGPARHIKTGVEINDDVVVGLMLSDEYGEQIYQ
jgi:hypothetical protein